MASEVGRPLPREPKEAWQARRPGATLDRSTQQSKNAFQSMVISFFSFDFNVSFSTVFQFKFIQPPHHSPAPPPAPPSPLEDETTSRRRADSMPVKGGRACQIRTKTVLGQKSIKGLGPSSSTGKKSSRAESEFSPVRGQGRQAHVDPTRRGSSSNQPTN